MIACVNQTPETLRFTNCFSDYVSDTAARALFAADSNTPILPWDDAFYLLHKMFLTDPIVVSLKTGIRKLSWRIVTRSTSSSCMHVNHPDRTYSKMSWEYSQKNSPS